MKELIEISEKLIELAPENFTRDFIRLLDRKDRLTGIKGARGTGKTTLVLQYIKKHPQRKKALYVSLDDLYFSSNKLIDLVDEFVKNGGRFLFIDEVHHYKEWSREIKLIYDRFPELRTVFTGSSMLHLGSRLADLSRRAVINTLPGLSLREFINLTEGTDFEQIGFMDILNKHQELSKNIWKRIKPIKKFREFVEFGYYPYFLENRESYPVKLKETINKILESDLPYITEIDYSYIDKLRQLLFIISECVPFKPNIQKLSERIGLGRNTLKVYLHYLSEAALINTLYADIKGISLLTKPEKIYLNNPNLMYALSFSSINTGTIRETFFLSQLHFLHKVTYPVKGDFLVDGKYLFEVGGKNKTGGQIANTSDSYLALDDIETGYKNQIPLWLFGFLY